MLGCTATLETSKSSASSHEVNTAEVALVKKELRKDKSSSCHIPFFTTEGDDHSVTNVDFSEFRMSHKHQ